MSDLDVKTKAVPCPECKGTGRNDNYILWIGLHPGRCQKCKGKGWVLIPENLHLVNRHVR